MEISITGAKVLATIENVPLFGTVQITQTLTASWLVMLIITGLCIWLGSGLRVTNISRKQAVAEMAVTSLLKFVRGNMGTGFDHYIPLIGTIFITSVVYPLIKSKLTNSQWETIKNYALAGVQAAEIIIGAGNGEKKFEEVKKYIEKECAAHGIKIDMDTVRIAIEKAWKSLGLDHSTEQEKVV